MPTIGCNGSTLERATFLDRVARTAGGLVGLGVAPGDRVALVAKNSIEFLEVTLATGRTGAFSVPINWHFTAVELDVLLDDCSPTAIFVQQDLLTTVPAAWLARVPVIVIDATEGPISYRVWRDGHSAFSGEGRVAPGSIVYTSGTTGRPKGVKRKAPTPEQQARMQAIRSDLYRIEAHSRVLVPGPLYHAFPNQFAIHAALTADHTEVMTRFDAEELLATIERERITSVAMAPIMFVRLLRLPPDVRSRYDLSSLTWAIHAGGPCAVDVKREMIAWWGPILSEYYGGTETGPLTLCTSEEWMARPGTCGRPLVDVELRIVDPDGRDAPAGQKGEVFGRLWAYPDFTYHNDQAKRDEIGRGQLVSLGDVGYQDSEGYLFLCDRARDMVVSGGVNIYPAEVESALFAIPGVLDCAAFGVPDPEYGERLVAYVCGEGLDGEALRQALRATLAGYKIPRAILPLASLDRDPSGKVRKQALRERYLATRQSDPSPRH